MLTGSHLLKVICLFSNYFYHSINYLQHHTTNAVILTRSRPFLVHSHTKKLFSKNNNNLQQPNNKNLHYLNQFFISNNKNFTSSIQYYLFNDYIFSSAQNNEFLIKIYDLNFFTIRESSKIYKEVSRHSRKAIANLCLYLASTSINLFQFIIHNSLHLHDILRKLILASCKLIISHHLWTTLPEEFSKLSLSLASQYNLIIFFLYLIFFPSNRSKFKLILSKSSFIMSYKSDSNRKRKSSSSISKPKPQSVKVDARSAAIRQVLSQSKLHNNNNNNNNNNIFNNLSSNSQDSIDESDHSQHNMHSSDAYTEPEIDISQQYQYISEVIDGENPTLFDPVPPDQKYSP